MGQGVYHIAGAGEMAQAALNIPTRFVNPKLPVGLKLSFVTALGIVKYVAGMSLGERDVEILNKHKEVEEIPTVEEEGLITKFIKFWKK